MPARGHTDGASFLVEPAAGLLDWGGGQATTATAPPIRGQLVEKPTHAVLLDIGQGDPRLCAASVDRLTFGGHIIETGTDPYCLARTRARAPDI